MDGSDQIQQVVATAARVKAGNASARDVAWLTAVRGGLVSSGNTTLVGTIDDALAAQSAAPATPADVPPTDWTVQPEIGGGPMPASFSEALATGQPPGGAPPASSTPPTPTIPWDFGTGALEGRYGGREPAPGLDIPTPTLDFMQSSPGDLLKGFMTAGLNDPGEGTLPPTQKPPAPDPLAAYQTAPASAAVAGTHMPGEVPTGGVFSGAEQTDWTDERRALKNEGLTPEERRARRAMGGDTLTLPPDSAFAGVTDINDLAYQPEMMARMLAQKMGGGAMTAAMILPEVHNAMALVQQGHIGGGSRDSGLGSNLSTTDQLLAIEDFVTGMTSQTGTQVDPYAAYQEGLKRSLHTPEEMLGDTGDAESSRTETLAAQIKHTDDALMAGIGGMGPGAAKKLQARLKQEANEWLDLAMRSQPGSYVTYPQFLKERGAKTWFR